MLTVTEAILNYEHVHILCTEQMNRNKFVVVVRSKNEFFFLISVGEYEMGT